MPAALVAFAAILFSDRYPSKLPIGVIAQENSGFSRELLLAFQNAQGLEVAKICSQEAECESALKSQKVLGVVHLPRDLEKRALRGENPVVGLYLNGQSMIAYNMLELSVKSIVAAHSQKFAKDVLPNPVKVEAHAINNASLDYRAYLGIGLVAATFHLAAMVMGAFIFGSLLRDGKKGNVAYSVPVLLILLLQHGIYAYVFHSWAGIYFSIWQWCLLLLASFFMIAAVFGFGALALAVSGSMRVAISAAGVVGGPAFAFAGIAFPIFAMPFGVQIFARILPLTHFLQIQNAIRMESLALPFVEKELAILAAMALFWCGAGFFGIRKRFRGNAPGAAQDCPKPAKISVLSEWSLFFKDKNAVLVLVVAIFLYAAYYPLPYLNGVVREIPVAVVDFDRTAMSRQLTGFFDASHSLNVLAFKDMLSAKQALAENKVYSILEIPENFERNVRAGRSSTIGEFNNGSYFMVHSEISRAALFAAATLGAGAQIAFMQARGISPELALKKRDPVPVSVKAMFNGAMRYDNYVVPAVIVVILQQTIVIGACILGVARGRQKLARGTAFMLHYFIALCFYIFAVYPFFGWNAQGKFLDVLIFAFAFFAACIQMGFFFARFFRKKESALQTFLFMSIPFLFISGFSWPKPCIPQFLHYALFWVPSEHAITAWISIQHNGATAGEMSAEIASLCILVAFYSALSFYTPGSSEWRRR